MFTNKTDIKPENILVKEDHDDVKFIHTDVGKIFIDTDDGKSLSCKGMFDIFIAHRTLNSFFNEKFLTLLWKRISSDELSKYFNEYIDKYTLTQDKIKKIISRTVRNVLRQNYDIKTQTQNNIDVPKIKKTFKELFFKMKLYMEDTKGLLEQEPKFQIKLDDGDDKKKDTLISVLEQNCKVLNALQDDEINKCVDEAIAKYNKQKYHPQSNINESDNKVENSTKNINPETRNEAKEEIQKDGNIVGQPTTNINPVQLNDANKTIHEDNGANSTNNTPTYTLYDNFCKNPYIGWDEHGNWHCCL